MMERFLTLYARGLGLFVIPWLPFARDKQLHFIAGIMQVVVLSVVIFATIGLWVNSPALWLWCVVAGCWISCVLAVAKERYDANHADIHTADHWDAIATICGSILGMALLVAMGGGIAL